MLPELLNDLWPRHLDKWLAGLLLESDKDLNAKCKYPISAHDVCQLEAQVELLLEATASLPLLGCSRILSFQITVVTRLDLGGALLLGCLWLLRLGLGDLVVSTSRCPAPCHSVLLCLQLGGKSCILVLNARRRALLLFLGGLACVYGHLYLSICLVLVCIFVFEAVSVTVEAVGLDFALDVGAVLVGVGRCVSSSLVLGQDVETLLD